MTAALKALPDPRCEWVPPGGGVDPCGNLAGWHVTTHDFLHENAPGPDSTRLWLMCSGCALGLLVWAKKEHGLGNGSYCRGCSTLITPMLGGFIISHGEFRHPESDQRYVVD